MNLYALDTDVVSSLRRVENGILLARRKRLPVVITDVVWQELSDHKGTLGLELEAFAEAIAGEATSFAPESAESEMFVQLQELPKTEGPGEHSVIAFCHHNPEVTPVLQDKGALRRAVEELRIRLLSFHGFVGVLVEGGYINWSEARAFAVRYRTHFSHSRIPIWWPPP